MSINFEERMIGSRVWEIETGDSGILTGQEEYGVNTVWVRWNDGFRRWIDLEDVTFKDPKEVTHELQEITINGKRYKLVPVE